MPDQITITFKMHCHIVSQLKCYLSTVKSPGIQAEFKILRLVFVPLREVITAALTNGGEFCPTENMQMGTGMVPDFEVISPSTVIPISSFT